MAVSFRQNFLDLHPARPVMGKSFAIDGLARAKQSGKSERCSSPASNDKISRLLLLPWEVSEKRSKTFAVETGKASYFA